MITGVGGFLGRYVARLFNAHGWDVCGVDGLSPDNAPSQSLKEYYSLRLPCKDFDKLVQRTNPNVCVNCAGRASVPGSFLDPSADFSENVALTFALLDTLRKYAPKCKFIHLSSAAVYGNPTRSPVSEDHSARPVSPYGFHKLLAEQIVQEFYSIHRVGGVSLRIFSAYGPGLRRQVLWDICHKALIDKFVRLQGTGRETRDFMHATDVALAVLRVIENAPMEGEVYNLASGEEIAIGKLALAVLDEIGIALPLEMDGIVPAGTPLHWRADISKLRSLGYESSVSLADGIKSFVGWAQAELGQ